MGVPLAEGMRVLVGLRVLKVVRFSAAREAAAVVDVREVRRFLRGRLARTGVNVGDLDLITAEIATNAVRHTASGVPGGCLWVAVSVARDVVRVEFTDDGGAYTAPGVHGRPDESGRGLLLVAALAQRWGWSVDEGGRTTVWAELARGRGRR